MISIILAAALSAAPVWLVKCPEDWPVTGTVKEPCTFSRWPPCRADGHNQHRARAAVVAFKHTHPCPANGRRSGSCPGYVIDHVCPLECCGLDTPVNMRWQTRAEAKAKDRWEGQCTTCTSMNRKQKGKIK